MHENRVNPDTKRGNTGNAFADPDSVLQSDNDSPDQPQNMAPNNINNENISGLSRREYRLEKMVILHRGEPQNIGFGVFVHAILALAFNQTTRVA